MLKKISLKFVIGSGMDNDPALVLIMSCGRIGDKLLSEPMLTRFTDAHMRPVIERFSRLLEVVVVVYKCIYYNFCD